MTEEQQKFYDLKHTTDYKVVGEDIDYKVFVDDEKKEVVLQFEETDSKTDWKHNLDILPWPLKLGNQTVWTTRGYARAYKSALDIPRNELITVYAKHLDYRLCIRGWSYGSAMAKITQRHMEITGWKTDELTTYGDVKCWLNPFYQAKANDVREYVTPNDAVTWCVPFFHSDLKCTVGPRFSIKELFHSDYYHQNYDKYDYGVWEDL